MPVIVKDLRFRYRIGPWILDGIDLRIARGESVAITGPSGSGKTTLIQLIGGLLAPTSGSVVRGDGKTSNGSTLDTSWVFQASNAFGRRTVRDNVAAGLFTKGIQGDRAERIVGEMLAHLGLQGLEDRRAASLSGGELQRVGIARALVGGASLILADEPTGQLDYDTTSLVADALVSARTPDSILVVATHDDGIATRCDRSVAIRNSRAIEVT